MLHPVLQATVALVLACALTVASSSFNSSSSSSASSSSSSSSMESSFMATIGSGSYDSCTNGSCPNSYICAGSNECVCPWPAYRVDWSGECRLIVRLPIEYFCDVDKYVRQRGLTGDVTILLTYGSGSFDCVEPVKSAGHNYRITRIEGSIYGSRLYSTNPTSSMFADVLTHNLTLSNLWLGGPDIAFYSSYYNYDRSTMTSAVMPSIATIEGPSGALYLDDVYIGTDRLLAVAQNGGSLSITGAIVRPLVGYSPWTQGLLAAYNDSLLTLTSVEISYSLPPLYARPALIELDGRAMLVAEYLVVWHVDVSAYAFLELSDDSVGVITNSDFIITCISCITVYSSSLTVTDSFLDVRSSQYSIGSFVSSSSGVVSFVGSHFPLLDGDRQPGLVVGIDVDVTLENSSFVHDGEGSPLSFTGSVNLINSIVAAGYPNDVGDPIIDVPWVTLVDSVVISQIGFTFEGSGIVITREGESATLTLQDYMQSLSAQCSSQDFCFDDSRFWMLDALEPWSIAVDNLKDSPSSCLCYDEACGPSGCPGQQVCGVHADSFEPECMCDVSASLFPSISYWQMTYQSVAGCRRWINGPCVYVNCGSERTCVPQSLYSYECRCPPGSVDFEGSCYDVTGCEAVLNSTIINNLAVLLDEFLDSHGGSSAFSSLTVCLLGNYGVYYVPSFDVPFSLHIRTFNSFRYSQQYLVPLDYSSSIISVDGDLTLEGLSINSALIFEVHGGSVHLSTCNVNLGSSQGVAMFELFPGSDSYVSIAMRNSDVSTWGLSMLFRVETGDRVADFSATGTSFTMDGQSITTNVDHIFLEACTFESMSTDTYFNGAFTIVVNDSSFHSSAQPASFSLAAAVSIQMTNSTVVYSMGTFAHAGDVVEVSRSNFFSNGKTMLSAGRLVSMNRTALISSYSVHPNTFNAPYVVGDEVHLDGVVFASNSYAMSIVSATRYLVVKNSLWYDNTAPLFTLDGTYDFLPTNVFCANYYSSSFLPVDVNGDCASECSSMESTPPDLCWNEVHEHVPSACQCVHECSCPPTTNCTNDGSCYCGSGFTAIYNSNGLAACYDVDECGFYNHNCQWNEVCVNGEGFYTCVSPCDLAIQDPNCLSCSLDYWVSPPAAVCTCPYRMVWDPLSSMCVQDFYTHTSTSMDDTRFRPTQPQTDDGANGAVEDGTNWAVVGGAVGGSVGGLCLIGVLVCVCCVCLAKQNKSDDGGRPMLVSTRVNPAPSAAAFDVEAVPLDTFPSSADREPTTQAPDLPDYSSIFRSAPVGEAPTSSAFGYSTTSVLPPPYAEAPKASSPADPPSNPPFQASFAPEPISQPASATAKYSYKPSALY